MKDLTPCFCLNTIHNLHYYQVLMQDMRGAIEAGEFEKFKVDFAAKRARISTGVA